MDLGVLCPHTVVLLASEHPACPSTKYVPTEMNWMHLLSRVLSALVEGRA